MLLYGALQQMGLQSSFIALAASLRTVNEHLHERFLIAILIIVQQARRGSLRLCHQLVASSLDQDVAQLVSNHSSMAATRQPMVYVRCSTIHGLRLKLLSMRSVSGATSITRHTVLPVVLLTCHPEACQPTKSHCHLHRRRSRRWLSADHSTARLVEACKRAHHRGWLP
jgi:hypothetical protein